MAAEADFVDWDTFWLRKQRVLAEGHECWARLELDEEWEGDQLLMMRLYCVSPFRQGSGEQPKLHVSVCFRSEIPANLLRLLLEKYGELHSRRFAVGWVANTSGTCELAAADELNCCPLISAAHSMSTRYSDRTLHFCV